MNEKIKYLILFLIWFPFRSVLRKVTTKRNAYHRLLLIGNLLGNLFYLFFPVGRKIIKRELEALGLYARPYVRETFQHIMKIEMEGIVFEDLNRSMVEKITIFQGLEYLDQSLRRGTGAVLALFHFGWHMHTIPALGYLGYKIYQIADPRPVDLQRKRSFFQRKVIEKRLQNANNLPVQFIKAGTYLRPIMRLLQKDNVLIVALDGKEAKTFDEYPFLGRRILLSPAMVKVAMKIGTPILPMLTYRGEDGRHRIIIHPPVHSNEPDEVMQRIIQIFEGYIRKRPHQYAQYMFSNALRVMKDKQEETALFAS